MALSKIMLAACASGALFLTGCGSPAESAAPSDAAQATAVEPAAGQAEADAGQGDTAAVAEADTDENASPLERGRAFLASNAQREGVTTTASGLQYEVLASGDGASPTATDRVRAHYHGTLIDGTVFDSSVDRGQPFETAVNGVIKGWQEALQLMRVGDKWKLFVPPELAYGEKGAGGAIGSNATLIFEVELLSIES